MRVAFVGKGGSGKSLIAGTLARMLARRGDRVLALDMDSVPGLALALGMRGDTHGPPERLAERRGDEWVVETPPAVIVTQNAGTAPDGVLLLTLGKLPGRTSPAASAVFRHAALGFDIPGWSVVGDLAGGTRQPAFGWSRFAETVALVAEPTAAGVLSARRIVASLPRTERLVAVASRTRGPQDGARLSDALGLELVGTVPYDDRVREAERAGRAPIDAAPDAPAIAAIADLIAAIEAAR